MSKVLAAFAVATVMGLSSASAQQIVLTDWRGGGVFTSVEGCLAGLTQGAGRGFTARYRHPGLNDNGPDAKISMFTQFAGYNIVHAGGVFPSSFTRVHMTTLGGSVVSNKPRMRITSQSPAPEDINANTPAIFLEGTIRKFSTFPGFENCNVDFAIAVFRP